MIGFFSWVWFIFSCFFAYMLFFSWMMKILSFTLLNDVFCCIPFKSSSFFSGIHLSYLGSVWSIWSILLISARKVTFFFFSREKKGERLLRVVLNFLWITRSLHTDCFVSSRNRLTYCLPVFLSLTLGNFPLLMCTSLLNQDSRGPSADSQTSHSMHLSLLQYSFLKIIGI